MANAATPFGIKAKSINSLTESSNEAQQCNLFYNSARDFVLRDTSWQFATKTAVLALRSEEPLRYVYAYQYPGDCLKVQMVTGDWYLKTQTDVGLVSRARFMDDPLQPDPSFPYALQNIDGDKVIVTDLTEAYAVYTKKVVDPTLFDPIFEEALTRYLASKIAVSVVGGDFGVKMEDRALGLYQRALAEAIATDENERKRPPRREPAMVRVRR